MSLRVRIAADSAHIHTRPSERNIQIHRFDEEIALMLIAHTHTVSDISTAAAAHSVECWCSFTRLKRLK